MKLNVVDAESLLKFNNFVKKISSIELLRFISSLMVLFWHYQQFYLPYNFFSNKEIYFNDKSNQPFFEYLSIFYNYGNLGVNFFFLISGFVFSYVYLGIEKKTSLKKFVVNRVARLYPLHIFTLFVVLFSQFYCQLNFNEYLIYKNNDLYHFFLNIFFISGWGFEKGPSFNGPIWSVSIEIIIYFLFFFIMIYKKKNLILKSVFLILILLIIRKLNAIFSDNFFININLVICGILFFTGNLIYLIFNYSYPKIILILFSLILILISVLGNFKSFIFLPAILILALSLEDILSKKIKKIFNFLGNLSYGIYLWHTPLQIILILFIKENEKDFILIDNNFFFLFYIFVVFFVSVLSYYFFEEKIRKKIRSLNQLK